MRRRNYNLNGSSYAGSFHIRGEPMNDKEFKQMLDSLIGQEEQRLQVNSEEFKQRHEEIMKLISEAGRNSDSLKE